MAATETVKSEEFKVSSNRSKMNVPTETNNAIKGVEAGLNKLSWLRGYFLGGEDPCEVTHKDIVEESVASKKEVAQNLNKKIVEAVEHAFDNDNTAIKDELAKFISSKIEKELASGDISDFEKEIATDIVKAVTSTICDCISNPEDLKKLDCAFKHNPEEAERLVLDALNKGLGNSAEKKILQTIDGIFYSRILTNVIKDPDWLVKQGFCSDSDTARAVADAFLKGDFSSIDSMDEMLLSSLKKGLENVGVVISESDEAAKMAHIPDRSAGVIDFSAFGGQKVKIDGDNSQVMSPTQIPFMPPIQQQTIPQQPQQSQQTIPQQSVPQITLQPQQSIQLPPPVNKILVRKEKSEAEKLSIKGAPSPSVEADTAPVKPDFITKDVKVVKDTPVSIHNPENDLLISVYPWLKDIEEICNELGQQIKFVAISKPNSKEASGLVWAYVYTPNGMFCEQKSFTIDASGVMYDRRPKFFPTLNTAPGWSYEDYPAYLIFSGGKENTFLRDNIRNYLIGGKDALPQRSAYRPEFYQLNKLVDMSSMPTNLMNSEMRKRIQNRLVNAMGVGVFSAALQHDRTSRWAFSSFNRKDESFVLTNIGVPYRFNGMCFANKKVEIHFTANGEAKIITE